MSKYDNINMSLSTLKRRLQSFNLARGRDASDIDRIREAIRREWMDLAVYLNIDLCGIH